VLHTPETSIAVVQRYKKYQSSTAHSIAGFSSNVKAECLKLSEATDNRIYGMTLLHRAHLMTSIKQYLMRIIIINTYLEKINIRCQFRTFNSHQTLSAGTTQPSWLHYFVLMRLDDGKRDKVLTDSNQ